MELQIKKIRKLPTSHWKNDLVISMVRLNDDDWHFIKFVKLNDKLIEALLTNTMQIWDAPELLT